MRGARGRRLLQSLPLARHRAVAPAPCGHPRLEADSEGGGHGDGSGQHQVGQLLLVGQPLLLPQLHVISSSSPAVGQLDGLVLLVLAEVDLLLPAALAVVARLGGVGGWLGDDCGRLGGDGGRLDGLGGRLGEGLGLLLLAVLAVGGVVDKAAGTPLGLGVVMRNWMMSGSSFLTWLAEDLEK